MHTSIRINQETANPITTISGSVLSYRYVFDRSSDSINSNQPGQDYIAINSNSEYLAFVLCDGVSQSFYGDLAARILGNELVSWLWENGACQSNHHGLSKNELTSFLSDLTNKASEEVARFDLSVIQSTMLKVVLEKKRELGSETTFTAGLINASMHQLYLFWMGDCRLRLWDTNGELTRELLGDDTFQTKERWSTHKGLVGELHTAIISSEKIVRVLTYSDGLSRLDQKITCKVASDRTLQRIVEESKALPTSDDISLLEIWLYGKIPAHPTKPKTPTRLKISINLPDRRMMANWQAVKNASAYEVVVQSSRGWQVYASEYPVWQQELNLLPATIQAVAVRSWVDGEASDWSKFMPVSIPLPDKPLPARSEDNVIDPIVPKPGSVIPLSNTRSLIPNRKRRKYAIIAIFCAVLLIFSGFASLVLIDSDSKIDTFFTKNQTTPTPTASPLEYPFDNVLPSISPEPTNALPTGIAPVQEETIEPVSPTYTPIPLNTIIHQDPDQLIRNMENKIWKN